MKACFVYNPTSRMLLYILCGVVNICIYEYISWYYFSIMYKHVYKWTQYQVVGNAFLIYNIYGVCFENNNYVNVNIVYYSVYVQNREWKKKILYLCSSKVKESRLTVEARRVTTQIFQLKLKQTSIRAIFTQFSGELAWWVQKKRVVTTMLFCSLHKVLRVLLVPFFVCSFEDKQNVYSCM